MNELQTWLNKEYTLPYKNEIKNILIDYFDRGEGLVNWGISGGEVIIDNYPLLEHVRIRGIYLKTPLTKALVSNCPNLRHLDLKLNELTELTISNCPKLETLNVEYNKLDKLDISTCPNLIELEASYNRLIDLNLIANQHIEKLDLSFNKIAKAEFLSLLPNPNNLKTLKINGKIVPMSEAFFNALPPTIQTTLWAYQNGAGVVLPSPVITPDSSHLPSPRPSTPPTPNEQRNTEIREVWEEIW